MTFFQKIYDWVKRQFASAFVEAQGKAEIAVKVTNILKDMVQSPVTRWIVDLTKVTWDNQALEIAQRYIPDIAAKTLLAHGIIVQSKTLSECLGRLAEYIKTLPLEEQAKYYVDFAAKLNVYFADGKIDFNESVLITQMIFRKVYHQEL